MLKYEQSQDKICLYHMQTTKEQISLHFSMMMIDELGFYVPSTVFQSFRDDAFLWYFPGKQ